MIVIVSDTRSEIYTNKGKWLFAMCDDTGHESVTCRTFRNGVRRWIHFGC